MEIINYSFIIQLNFEKVKCWWKYKSFIRYFSIHVICRRDNLTIFIYFLYLLRNIRGMYFSYRELLLDHSFDLLRVFSLHRNNISFSILLFKVLRRPYTLKFTINQNTNFMAQIFGFHHRMCSNSNSRIS